jgi:hypothetical protein
MTDLKIKRTDYRCGKGIESYCSGLGQEGVNVILVARTQEELM